jgi:hypothetical protein
VEQTRCRRSAVCCKQKVLIEIFSRIVKKDPGDIGGDCMQRAGLLNLPTGRRCGEAVSSLVSVFKLFAIPVGGKCLQINGLRLEKRNMGSAAASILQKAIHGGVATRTLQVIVRVEQILLINLIYPRQYRVRVNFDDLIALGLATNIKKKLAHSCLRVAEVVVAAALVDRDRLWCLQYGCRPDRSWT